MPASAKYNLKGEEGNRLRRRFFPRDHRGLPEDFTNRLFRFTIRETADASSYLVDAREEDGYFYVNRPTENQINTLMSSGYSWDSLMDLLNTYFEIDIDSQEMAGWNFDSAVWNIEGTKITRSDIEISAPYTQCAVDVNNGSGRGVLTANAGTPFSAVSIGDVIIISDSQSGNEGAYTVLTATSTVITFETALRGSDHAGDSTIVLSVCTEDLTDVVRYVTGRVRINRETVR